MSLGKIEPSGKGGRGAYHGHIARPIQAHIYPPLLILRYRGSNAVISVPADTEFAAMFVPNCANAKAKEMMKTPNLAGPFAVLPVFGLIKKYESKFSGFQIGSP